MSECISQIHLPQLSLAAYKLQQKVTMYAKHRLFRPEVTKINTQELMIRYTMQKGKCSSLNEGIIYLNNWYEY